MKQRTSILSRMFVVFGLLALLPTAIVFQLLRIQFADGAELRKLWSQQTLDDISIPAQRGNIYDDEGRLMVTNSVAYKVAVDPLVKGMSKGKIEKLCATLASHTRRSAAEYRRMIRSAPRGSRYVVLESRVKNDIYESLTDMELPGLILEERYQRRYTYNELASHVLGYVNHELRGMMGLEDYYNQQLKGKDGLQQVRRDRNNRIYAYVGAPKKEPRQGHNLHTTLDAHIQTILEDELEEGVKYMKAKEGVAIVLDPRTGAVKAMANYPTFNPNKLTSRRGNNRRNFAISDIMEPGSTFKIVTAITAVEQNAVDMTEVFETPEDGKVRIHGQLMQDHKPLGNLTFAEVIQKSSNIATSRIAMRLEPKVFYQYARNLGFGTPTNIDLAHESAGRLRKPYKWSSVTLPWISIGYEVQVTPVQLAQAYASFANNGKMMQPYLVKKITDQKGEVIQRHKPSAVRRVADRETIETLRPIFKNVVSDSGTASWAQVKGLTIAGKTGTAQKLKDGQYQSKYRASFVGFYPYESPRYVTLVLLDEPKRSFYGGFAAGSIFRKVTNRIAALDNEIEQKLASDTSGVPNGNVMVPKVTGLNRQQANEILKKHNLKPAYRGNGQFIIAQHPIPDSTIKRGNSLSLTTDTIEAARNDSSYAQVPDLIGMSIRNATQRLIEAGFTPKIIGSGNIVRQYPRKGARMQKGKQVTVRGDHKSLEALTINSN